MVEANWRIFFGQQPRSGFEIISLLVGGVWNRSSNISSLKLQFLFINRIPFVAVVGITVSVGAS